MPHLNPLLSPIPPSSHSLHHLNSTHHISDNNRAHHQPSPHPPTALPPPKPLILDPTQASAQSSDSAHSHSTPEMSGFTFGTAAQPAAATGFTFGAPAAPAAPAAAPTTFSFGTAAPAAAPAAPAAAPATGGFTFGSAAAAPASTGFSFGAPAAPAAPAAAAATAAAAAAAPAPAPSQPHPMIRPEQQLSTLPQDQQKKIAYLDEVIKGQKTYNDYVSQQLQTLYLNYPNFFIANNLPKPTDTTSSTSAKYSGAGGMSAGQTPAVTDLDGTKAGQAGEDSAYISPQQLFQILSGIYLSITTDAQEITQLRYDLEQEETNIDDATRQLSLLLTNTSSSSANSSVAYLTKFQQSHDYVQTPSPYQWTKLKTLEKKLQTISSNISTITESLAVVGLLDSSSVDTESYIQILSELLHNQSMSLLTTTVRVSRIVQKITLYKSNVEKIIVKRGADHYVLNQLNSNRINRTKTDSAQIPLTALPSASTTSKSSTLPPTQLIPTAPAPGAPQLAPAAATTAAAPAAAAPSTGGFNFGSATAAPAAGGFSFGAPAAPAAAPAAPQTGFSFGQPAAAPALAAAPAVAPSQLTLQPPAFATQPTITSAQPGSATNTFSPTVRNSSKRRR